MPDEISTIADSLLDGWLVPPDTARHRKRSHGTGGRTMSMAIQMADLVDQFLAFQLKQKGKTESGVQTYRWNIQQFLIFARIRHTRPVKLTDLNKEVIQAWMDHMAADDLALSTMRVRQCSLSSFCSWLVKRDYLEFNPVLKLDRPPARRAPPAQVPSSRIMDALIEAAKSRKRPRDVALFLILRYTGMRRESVATLRVYNIDPEWGLRRVTEKGGRTRDIPLPEVVRQFLKVYVSRVLPDAEPTTPLFWSTWGKRSFGKTREPMTGKNVWRLCKVYGRMIGYPQIKPHDLRHGVAMEIYEEHRDLEVVREVLGHTRLDTTQIYAQIRPQQLKEAVSFYEERAYSVFERKSERHKTRSEKVNT